MSSTFKLTQTVQVDNVTQDVATIAVTDDDANKFSAVIPHPAVDHAIALNFTIARLKAIWIKSDQPIDLFTNAADGTGGNHFVLEAGSAVAWVNGSGLANPITHDVTGGMFADNAGTAVANLVIITVLHDE